MTTDATTIENTASGGEHDSHTRVRPSYDDINVPVILLIGLISAVITLLIIWLVEGLYYRWNNQLVRERTYGIVNSRQVDEINSQKEQLNGVPDLGYESLESVVPDVLGKYQPAAGSESGSSADPADDH